MQIIVNVVGQTMTATNSHTKLITGTQNFIRFTFLLDEDWKKLTNIAQFRQNGVAYDMALDANGECYLPPEIGVGTCTMILWGTGQNQTKGVSNYLTFLIGNNQVIDGINSTPISQSLYDQLIARVNSAMTWNEQKTAELTETDRRLQAQINRAALQADLDAEITRATTKEDSLEAQIRDKASSSDVRSLRMQVENFVNNETVASLIQVSVEDEMQRYLNSGQLGAMTIGDGSIAEVKLSDALKEKINAANSAMLPSVYDPQNLQMDIFTYAKGRADAVKQQLEDFETELRNNYVLYTQPNYKYSTLQETLEAAVKYNESYTRGLLSDYKAFTISVVDQLPEIGQEMTFYLVPNKSNTGFDKYWWIRDNNAIYKWDVFGSSTTLVVSELPAVGDEDTDYILQSDAGCLYYKYIGGLWRVVAGSLAVVSSSLPDEGNEFTDYYILNRDDGRYSHYRWINGDYRQIGTSTYSQAQIDNAVNAVQANVDELREYVDSVDNDLRSTKGKVDAVEASVESLGNMVGDITENETGINVHYKDGSVKTVTTKSNEVVVTDVNKSENGILISFSDNDSKEIEISGGGGGGESTSGSGYIERITQSPITCVYGDSCNIEYSLTAMDSAGDLVGSGTATWLIGNIKKATSIAYQGNNSFDIGPYLNVGNQTVKVSISIDTGGDRPLTITKTWNVNAINMYLTWDYDDTTVNVSDTVAIRWTPYGNISKTSHIIIDGEEVYTGDTTRSGVEQYALINKLSHGSHLAEIYLTADVNGVEIRSESKYHDMMFADAGNNTPIISVSLAQYEMMQYDTLQIPVAIYTPSSLTSNAVLKVNGTQVAEWRDVDRTLQHWNYSPNEEGEKTLTITSGVTTKTVRINVTKLNIDNEEVPGYAFRLKASDLAGNDALRAWNSNGVTVSFSNNFDWNNGGIKTEYADERETIVRQFICIKAGTTMTINYDLFGNDAKINGKNFKVIFKPVNSRDYDATWLDCMDSGIGITLKANGGTATSEQNTVSVSYAEDTYTEFEYDIYPDSGFRYIQTYIDGVLNSANVYASNDNFTQTNKQKIVLGSPDCDIYIYMVKLYETFISRDNHIVNFIADAPNAQEMVARYNRNDILDDANEISYERLSEKNPNIRIHLWDIPRMTQGKKDYVTGCSYQQIWAAGEQRHQITAENVTMSIQGTSSVDYKDSGANTDGNFTEGFTDGNGNHIDGYSMTDDSVPVNYMNTKVNIASCENVNNMCLAEWYNRYQPYKRQFRRNNPNVRDCMELHMGVQFMKDQSHELFEDDNYHMYAICNMGNSKKNSNVFHDVNNPLECCLETKDNNSIHCLMQSTAFTEADLDTESFFEFRYPSSPTSQMKTKFVEFVRWMAANDPQQATNNNLPRAVTFAPYVFRGTGYDDDVLGGLEIDTYAGTYTKDTYEYRMAKLLSECEDHLIMDSLVYHYVFVEEHTMVDNVAKNTFWGTDDLQHWYLCHNYDNDTADGNDNNGKLIIPYGCEGLDSLGVRDVFNGRTCVWWTFVYGLYEARQRMWLNRENAGAWDADKYLAYVKECQDIIPERVYNQDYWYKYLRLYESGGITRYMDMLEGGKKTHQRQAFVQNNMYYMAGQYVGTKCTSKSITVRGYTPDNWTGVEPKSQVEVMLYTKGYIVVQIGSAIKRVKAEKGEWHTIVFTDSGKMNDTVINIHGANLVQAVGDISCLYIGAADFSNATRLRSLQIGSPVSTYHNDNFQSVSFGTNTMLENLYIQNCPNIAQTLDLKDCQALRNLDIRGSGFTGITFATGGLVENAKLNSPSSLQMISLYNLTDDGLSLEGYNNLTTLRLEDCPNLDTMGFINNTSILSRLRMLNINWTLGSTDILNRIFRTMSGLDENNHNIEYSVLTGDVYVSGPIRNQELANYALAWPNLNVTYEPGNLIEQYLATYVNADGTTLYQLYVDRGSTPPDVVAEGYIDAPTMAADAQYIYDYNGWENLEGAMLTARTITASYDKTVRTYNVKWYSKIGGNLLGSRVVEYGTDVTYEGDVPTDESEEGTYIYNIFKGWSASTGCIKEDTNVYAQWDRAALPAPGADLKNMSPAEIYGIVKSGRASEYFVNKDYFDMELGHDFNFNNIRSNVIANDVELDGRTYIDTGVSLFGEDEESFTLAIDFRFTSTEVNSTLVSAYDEIGQEGFRLRYNNGANIQWGNTAQIIGYQNYRDIVVLRHKKGDTRLYIYCSNAPTATVFSDTISRYELLRSRATTESLDLGLGAIKFKEDGGNDDYGAGYIYWAKIWHDDLGETNCRQLATWYHEKVRMEYYGTGRYRLAGGGSQKCGASFIMNNCLCDRRKRMNPTNSNAGGWDASEMRTFLNSKFYSGLPVVWQNVIKKVRIPSTDGSQSANVLLSEDYVYLASYIEMQPTTDANYIGEGEHIPWYTTLARRAKFMGGIIPETVSYYIEANDPSTNTANNLKVGDVWERTSDSRHFIYVAKKDYIKNGMLNDSLIDLNNGYVWATAWYYWCRSAYVTNTAHFWYVYISGHLGNSNATNTYAVSPGFSI